VHRRRLKSSQPCATASAAGTLRLPVAIRSSSIWRVPPPHEIRRRRLAPCSRLSVRGAGWGCITNFHWDVLSDACIASGAAAPPGSGPSACVHAALHARASMTPELRRSACCICGCTCTPLGNCMAGVCLNLVLSWVNEVLVSGWGVADAWRRRAVGKHPYCVFPPPDCKGSRTQGGHQLTTGGPNSYAVHKCVCCTTLNLLQQPSSRPCRHCVPFAPVVQGSPRSSQVARNRSASRSGESTSPPCVVLAGCPLPARPPLLRCMRSQAVRLLDMKPCLGHDAMLAGQSMPATTCHSANCFQVVSVTPAAAAPLYQVVRVAIMFSAMWPACHPRVMFARLAATPACSCKRMSCMMRVPLAGDESSVRPASRPDMVMCCRPVRGGRGTGQRSGRAAGGHPCGLPAAERRAGGRRGGRLRAAAGAGQDRPE